MMSAFKTFCSVSLKSASLIACVVATAYAAPGNSGHGGFPPGDSNVLTGCLHEEGQVRRFAEGQEPVMPCNPNEKIIHLQKAGGSGVEPFTLALNNAQTKVITEENGLQYSAECLEGQVFLYYQGDAIPSPLLSNPVVLSEPVDDTILPALLSPDGSFLSIHGVHIAIGLAGADCIVTGIIHRAKVGSP